jgi:glucose/mannose-6-phosphate isomerase
MTAGRALRRLAAPTLPVPVLVEGSYELPACIGKRSLVFAISGSGRTDEVNHAAAEAARREARLVMVTTGGWLVDLAESCGAPVVRIPEEVQPARAAFGAVLASLMSVLDEIGLLPEAGRWIETAVAQLDRRRQELARPDNLATRLAARLIGRHVTIQGDAALGVVAAERWKAQINQNARQPASFSAQPNASHNEAVAWDCERTGESPTEAVVLLRHQREDPRVARDMDMLADYLRGKVPVQAVRADGDGRLAILMDLIMIGDFVSLRMAELNGVDPSSMPFISETLKEGLVPPTLSRTAGPKKERSHGAP